LLSGVNYFFAALAKAWDQGSGPKVVHLGEGNLQSGSLALEIVERLRQERFLAEQAGAGFTALGPRPRAIDRH